MNPMKFSRGRRVILILFLLTVLFSLLVVGGIDRPPAPELGIYPHTEEIAQQSTDYQNQSVSFVAQVVSTEPVIVRATYGTELGAKSIRLKITELGAIVNRGDRLQIFGVLIGPQTVRATNVVVVPQSGLWYVWVISFIAGLWILGRIIRHWKIDLQTWAFLPRAEPLQLFHRGNE